jgi:hypothetical protein
MRVPAFAILAAIFLLSPGAKLVANIIEEGTGLIHGKNHLFSLTAPPGWVLDNESGVSQGVVAVFYPKETTWGNAKMTCYSRSAEISKEIRTPADVVQRTVRDFRAHGNPKYEARRVKSVRARAGAEGVIWHFQGDQWGNYEAGAYFPAKKRINSVIFTARSKADFEQGLPAFEALAKSYRLLSEAEDPTALLKHAVDAGVPLNEDPSRSLKSFEEVAKLAHDMGETEEGKAFEHSVIEVLGQTIVDASSTCLASVTSGSEVQLVLIFDASGRVMSTRHAEGDKVGECLTEKLRGQQGVRPPKAQWMMLFKFRMEDTPKPSA